MCVEIVDDIFSSRRLSGAQKRFLRDTGTLERPFMFERYRKQGGFFLRRFLRREDFLLPVRLACILPQSQNQQSTNPAGRRDCQLRFTGARYRCRQQPTLVAIALMLETAGGRCSHEEGADKIGKVCGSEKFLTFFETSPCRSRRRR